MISFRCASCDADFEIEIPKVIEHPKSIKCDNCGAQPGAHRSHALATALEDLLAAMAAIRNSVGFEIELDTNELPPPYGKIEEQAAGGLDGGLSFDDDDDDDEEEDEFDNFEEFDEDDDDDDDEEEEAVDFGLDDDDDDDDFEDDFDDDDDDDDDFDELGEDAPI